MTAGLILSNVGQGPALTVRTIGFVVMNSWCAHVFFYDACVSYPSVDSRREVKQRMRENTCYSF